MKKLKKLQLDKEVIVKLEKEEMSNLQGKGIYYQTLYFPDSINTRQTLIESCCYGREKTC